MRAPVLVLSLLALLGAGCAAHQTRLFPPPAAPILLDGRVDSAEWAVAPLVPEHGDVHMRLDEHFLYVAVRSNTSRPVHLYLARSREVHVLQASGSLGRAVYHRTPGRDWNLEQMFAWEVRDPALGRVVGAPDVEEERALYLQRNGWAANTIRTGIPGHVEFKISRRYLEPETQHLSISYFWMAPDSSMQIRHYPQEAIVTPEEHPLLMGENVPAQFTLQGWLPLSASRPAA